MLSESILKELLHVKGLSKTNQLLLCLAVRSGKGKEVDEIKKLASDAGLRAVRSWNVSALLGGSRGKAIRAAAGWELTASGKKVVSTIAGPLADFAPPAAAVSLRAHLAKIANSDTAAFVEEAILCFEAKHYRAATVLSWVGALSVLYNHVIAHHLAAFNAEALRKDSKWHAAVVADDLARMKERNFLDVIEAISVIGKSVKKELIACLDLRNGCGHPNSLKIGEARVSAHIEILILNIFSRFK